MKTRIALAVALAVGLALPAAAKAQSLKELLQQKLKGKSALEQEADKKKAQGTATDKLNPSGGGDMFKAMREKIDKAPKTKSGLQRVLDGTENLLDSAVKKAKEIKDDLTKPKEEKKEKTLLDEWREQEAKKKAEEAKNQKPKEKSIEEIIKEKMGKK